MANNIRIASAAGNINFSPGSGSGYEIAMNDTTGPLWTLQASPGLPLFSGGPPFTPVKLPFDLSYDTMTETIPIQITGANHNAIVALLRSLRRALMPIPGQNLPMLIVQPDAATNQVVFAITHGSVQEDPRFTNVEAGRGTLRAIMTLQRATYGLGTAAATSFEASSITNNANSGNSIAHAASQSGDKSYRGQPIATLQTSSGAFSTSGIKRFYLGTLDVAPSYTERSDAISTTSTTGVTVGATIGYAPTNQLVNGVRFRVVACVTSPTSTLQLRITVTYGSSGTGATVYQSTWRTPGNPSAAYVDFGSWTFPEYFQMVGSTFAFRVQVEARSSTGASATGTLDYVEMLSCITWCRITSTVSLASTAVLRIIGSMSTTHGGQGGRQLLQSPLVDWSISGDPLDFPEVRGELPIVGEGMSLYAAWQSADVHAEAATVDIAVTYDPLFFTLRGAG